MKRKTCAIRCGAVAGEVVCELQLGKLDPSVDVQRHLRDRHPDRAGDEAADWHEHDQVWLRWLCTLYNLRSLWR